MQTTTATSVPTTSLSWNGTQWIQIASAPSSNPPSFNTSHQRQNASVTKIPPPKTQLPPIPAHLNRNGDQSLMSLDQLVSLYSNVYHHYAAEVSSFKNNNFNTVREAGRTQEWAVYHCDLSARAAHHYNDLLTNRQNKNAAAEIKTPGPAQVQEQNTQLPNQSTRDQHQEPTPLPFDNTSTSNTPSKTRKATTSTSTSTSTSTRTEESSLEQPPPESFRRYAHKNLLLCTTDTQRRAMEELLTMTMVRAIQNGTFQSTEWDYESLLPLPGGGPSQPLQEKSNAADNKMKTVSFGNLINLPSNSIPVQKKNDSKGETASTYPTKVSSEFSSLKRNHSSSQYVEQNHSQNDQEEEKHRITNHPTAETASNLAQQQRTVNDWYGNATTQTNREHIRTGGAINNDTLDGTQTKTLKTIRNTFEQKTTLNDWYGGSAEGDSSTNDSALPAGACITFEPKIFKKKKRHNRGMNSMKRQGSCTTAKDESKNQNPSREIVARDDVVHVSLIMEGSVDQSYTTASSKKALQSAQQKKNVSEWYSSNGAGNDNINALSSSPSRNIIQENHFKYDANIVAQQSSKAKLQLEQQNQIVSEWHNYSQPLTSSPSSTVLPHKKEIEMQQQKQTLDEWYGGNDATGSKNDAEALIIFKPKPLKKKKKKNRKYMNRSLAAVKVKVSGTRDEELKSRVLPSIVGSGSLNGITMLPRVQTDPTKAISADNYRNPRRIAKEGYSEGVTNTGEYNLHQNKNHDETCHRASKQKSSPHRREKDFMPLSQIQSKTTNQQPGHHDTKMNFFSYNDRVGHIDDTTTMEDYNSESCSIPNVHMDTPIVQSYHLQNKGTTDRYDVSPPESNQNSYILHRYKQLSNNIEGKMPDNELEDPKTMLHNSVPACQLTQSYNNYVTTARLPIRSSPVSDTSINLRASNEKKGKIKSNVFEQLKNKMACRASRFSGHGGIATAASSNLHMEYSHNADRYMGKSVIGGTLDKILTEEDYENMTVKGYCQVLEKSYLRLTSPPRAELVRPQHVLKQHLANLKKKWLVYRMHICPTGNSNVSIGDEMSYTWFCSQLKAVRQDLVVQRIFNSFAVEVYEMHAKIALQENDLNEYNQSQTQLKDLYNLLSHQGLEKKGIETVLGMEHQNEFIAYRIIYFIFLTGNQKYDGGSSDLLKIMFSLSPEQREDFAIIHALKVRVAVAENDYHAFFQLHDTCPNLGSYLMDTLVPHVRALALKQMMKAYKPSISTLFLLQELGFNMDGGDDEGGEVWLHSCGCKFSHDRSMVMTKKSNLNEAHLTGVRYSSLI